MRILDLDEETRILIAWAHIVVDFPEPENIDYLRKKIQAWDLKHQDERFSNLLRFLNEDIDDGK